MPTPPEVSHPPCAQAASPVPLLKSQCATAPPGLTSVLPGLISVLPGLTLVLPAFLPIFSLWKPCSLPKGNTALLHPLSLSGWTTHQPGTQPAFNQYSPPHQGVPSHSSQAVGPRGWGPLGIFLTPPEGP